MASDLHGFTDSEVITKFALMFALHCLYRFKVIDTEILRAVLVVLGDAGVLPLLSVNGLAMFVPSGVERAGCLADVDWLVGAGAGVFVYSFFLDQGCVSLIFAA